MTWQLLRRSADPAHTTVEASKPAGDDHAERIRCPLCDWEPDASSRWGCVGLTTPEHPFRGCGTVWNTFDTRGRCPGCGHRWRWTSCLRCAGWSLHEDWYAPD